jgi:hypothetical protein
MTDHSDQGLIIDAFRLAETGKFHANVFENGAEIASVGPFDEKEDAISAAKAEVVKAAEALIRKSFNLS